MNQYKYGLKLWSNNEGYVESAEILYKSKVYDYIELYVLPGTYDKYLNMWRRLGIPFMIHCAHSLHGFNLAEKTKLKINQEIFSEAQAFCNELDSKYIIFHPGVKGGLKECIRQIKLLKDPRLLLENKPNATIKGEICVGSVYSEVVDILNSCGIGFCLDIPHAFYTAYQLKLDEYKYIEEMAGLQPAVVHIADGKVSPFHDEHLNIGQGDFDFKRIKKIISVSGAEYITLETCKNSDELVDFSDDIKKIRDVIDSA